MGAVIGLIGNGVTMMNAAMLIAPLLGQNIASESRIRILQRPSCLRSAIALGLLAALTAIIDRCWRDCHPAPSRPAIAGGARQT